VETTEFHIDKRLRYYQKFVNAAPAGVQSMIGPSQERASRGVNI